MIDHRKFFTAFIRDFPIHADTDPFNTRFLVINLNADLRVALASQKAYLLATVLAECGPDFEPIVERGSFDYFHKYDAGTPLGIQLGNTLVDDGFKYRGRGYVQLTGRRNYSVFSHLLDKDLLDHPDLCLNPVISYEIMARGMIEGHFTGKKLSDYISAEFSDYVGARRVINGLDRAHEIAASAEKFERIIVESNA